ncbi:MAG TPA: MFS transporter [Verrucomicrobiae bacterium]|nr:MFS transporter [Verrucomicrobiae bacterium]
MELRVTGGDLSTTMLDHEPQPEQPSGGWSLVLALSVAQLVSWGTVYYSFSLLILPMEAELGWTRTGISGALSFGLLIAGLSAYGAGSWIERHGGRWLMTVGTVLASLMLAAWSQVHTLTALYLIWAGLGVAMAATLYEPVFVVLTRRFPQSFRLRITVLTLVAGFASTIFMPLTEILVQSQGWRGALLILAAINLAMCLPIHALWLRDNATRDRPTPPPIDRKALLARALRNPVFWGLALCLMAYNATFSALTFHLIPLLAERGVGIAVAIAAVALIGPSQVAARLLIFLFARRLPTALTGRIVLLGLPVSLVLLIRFPDSTSALFLAAVYYGGANGIMTTIRSAAVPDLMSRDGYGSINGMLGFPAMIAQALSPLAAAVIWSLTGGYDAVLWTLLAMSTIAAMAFWAAAALAKSRPSAEAANLPARR